MITTYKLAIPIITNLKGLNLTVNTKKLSYWKSIITTKKYTSLTRFRLSSHELLIEKERHLLIQREDRLSKYCNMNMVENEYHFLLVCPKYANLRKQYLTNYCRWPSVEKFKNLMSSKTQNN